MRHLELDALRAFVAIADHGSFSGAALQLGRTQSAVSLQIKRLEQALGQTLLRRVQGRVDGPTAEGGALLAYARQLLRLNDEACAALACNAAPGSLRIGLPEELMDGVLPAALPAFRALQPRLRLCVQADGAAAVRAALADGRLDLAVYKDCGGGVPAGVELLREEPLCWALGEAYRDTLTADGSTLPLALFGDNCAFRLAATAALATAGIAWQLQYTGSGPGGLRQAVRHGLGLSVLPQGLLGDGLVAVEACAGIALPRLPPARLLAAYAAGEVAPAARRFVAVLGDCLRRQPTGAQPPLSISPAMTAR